jgi:hypothetical protein
MWSIRYGEEIVLSIAYVQSDHDLRTETRLDVPHLAADLRFRPLPDMVTRHSTGRSHYSKNQWAISRWIEKGVDRWTGGQPLIDRFSTRERILILLIYVRLSPTFKNRDPTSLNCIVARTLITVRPSVIYAFRARNM